MARFSAYLHRAWCRALNYLLAILAAGFALPAFAAPVVFHVVLGQASATPASGRMLVFAKKLEPSDKRPLVSVDIDQIDVHVAAVAAQEMAHLEPGATFDLDADLAAFPVPFSQLKPGRYAVQAVLDRHHSYNYTGRGAGDLVSDVIEMELPGDTGQALTLSTGIPESSPEAPGVQVPDSMKDVFAAAKKDVHPISFVSPALSRFWGRPVTLRAWVVTPPDYVSHPARRYPTVYFSHGFGGTLGSVLNTAVGRWEEMRSGKSPPMIWVGLDQTSPTGTSEFADSVNNGPWGEALTRELIPSLEQKYRMDANASGRLLTGHSSGGWAALWLQVKYPRLFGGAWPTSPDPSDFHDFLGIDLYGDRANVYHKADGTPWPLARDKGQVLVSIEDYTRREVVLGSYGGQLASFDWVFSPRDADGRPIPMFDRATGVVAPLVIAYWREHYDVAEYLRRHWSALRGALDGKIHLTVGAADTFYLDGAAHRLEATMKGLGAKTDFRYIEGRGHFDLYVKGEDPWGLYKTIASEMYAVARPKPPKPSFSPATTAH
jgi:Putative esterase